MQMLDQLGQYCCGILGCVNEPLWYLQETVPVPAAVDDRRTQRILQGMLCSSLAGKFQLPCVFLGLVGVANKIRPLHRFMFARLESFR